MSTLRLVSIAVLATLITACGQKGPLILPDDAKPAPTSNGKPVSTKPAASKPLSGNQIEGKQLSTEPVQTQPISTKPYSIE